MILWLKGLASAAISGVSVAVLLYFANLLNAQGLRDWDKFLLVMAIGGLTGLAGYLKQSPLPK